MKKLLLLALPSLTLMLSAVFLSSVLHAQNIPPSHPQPDSIIRIIPAGAGEYTYLQYTIGGRLVNAEEVKERLAAYPPSAIEYTIVRHNITAAWITFGGFAVSSFAAVIDYAHNNKHAGETTGLVNGQPGFIYQQHSLTGAYILTGVAVACLTSAIVTFVTAKNHARKALKVYNQRFE
jgi:ABC-type Fe3+-siderophore transport system permease subunit